MESVAAEHEEANLRAGPERSTIERANGAPIQNAHDDSGQGEADGEIDENGRVRESVFDDDESGAPDERAEKESEISAGAFREHGARKCKRGKAARQYAPGWRGSREDFTKARVLLGWRETRSVDAGR